MITATDNLEYITLKTECTMIVRVTDKSKPNELQCVLKCREKECQQYDKCGLWRVAETLAKHLQGRRQ